MGPRRQALTVPLPNSPWRLYFRRAEFGDVPRLRGWEQADHVSCVMGTDPGWQWETELAVQWQEVWICEVDGCPIGVVVVLDAESEPTRYWGEVSPGTFAIDIWIGEPDALRRGYGTAMMTHAIERAFVDHHAHTILIDPLVTNLGAITFHRRLGLTDVGERRLGNDDCLVLRIERHDWTRPGK